MWPIWFACGQTKTRCWLEVGFCFSFADFLLSEKIRPANSFGVSSDLRITEYSCPWPFTVASVMESCSDMPEHADCPESLRSKRFFLSMEDFVR